MTTVATTSPTLICFDVFGTVFDLSTAARQEVRDYAAHIRREEWSPLVLPSSWERLPPHPDSVEGVERLRRAFLVVTLSNGPLGMLARLSKNGGVRWDAITPLELNRVFKPNPRAYLTACEVYGVEPQDVLMVTANEKFGDLEASRSLGMQAVLVRGESGPKTIVELAESLGC